MVDDILEQLRAAADPKVRADMSDRYGIHTEQAFGVTMAKMKVIAKPLGTDHGLATELWATGWYEARMIASLIDDPAAVTSEQMDEWCAEFDNWAIVDTFCFNLFDRTPHAWSKVAQWASIDQEMVKRAGFALLWALALHDRRAGAARFRAGLGLIEREASDERHLVGKAIAMALRSIGKRLPEMRPEVLELATRLAASSDRAERTIGRSTIKYLS